MSSPRSPVRKRQPTIPGFRPPPRPKRTPIAEMTVRELQDLYNFNKRILASPGASTSTYVDRIRAEQVAVESRLLEAKGFRLPRLPRELVHEVFNDLWIQKILEILCNHNSPYLDDCTSSHFRISKFLPPAQLAKVKESFALYLRICALHRGNPHPHIPILENAWPYFNEKLKGNHPVDIEREIRGAIVTELDKYTKFIPVLNSVVPDHIIPWGSPAFRDVSQKGLKEAFDHIDEAEVKLNTIKANQLRRLAGILERYPNYVRTCCEKGSEGTSAQKQSHRVAYLRTQADNMLMRQILDGRFVARAIFAQEQFYLVPYNRVLRLFMKVLCRFPPEDVKPPVQEQPRKADDEDEDERWTSDSQRTPPPRVMHTEYSLPKHRGYGGPAQPHFFLYNFHPTPREMNKWDGIWPFPDKEFEWLEGFLSICDYMGAMKEEWSVGRFCSMPASYTFLRVVLAITSSHLHLFLALDTPTSSPLRSGERSPHTNVPLDPQLP
ncbi:hypothetical protein NMY22_g9562 [Coprinellus aureogranulatus]|nr:hypothetical protein NMY22_g9562 [Coprinellus aureogranulatus]